MIGGNPWFWLFMIAFTIAIVVGFSAWAESRRRRCQHCARPCRDRLWAIAGNDSELVGPYCSPVCLDVDAQDASWQHGRVRSVLRVAGDV